MLNEKQFGTTMATYCSVCGGAAHKDQSGYDVVHTAKATDDWGEDHFYAVGGKDHDPILSRDPHGNLNYKGF